MKKRVAYKRMSLDEFISRSNNAHDFKYIYSKSKYKNIRTKVEIICLEHGAFWQRPNDHINSKHGCPLCSASKGEKMVMAELDLYGIVFKYEKTFPDLIGDKNLLRLDFYFQEHGFKYCIEYQGKQHYDSESFYAKGKNIQKYDLIKKEFCKKNNIKLLEIKYNDKNWKKKIENFLS